MITIKSKQRGFIHLQTLLLLIVVVGVLAFVGIKVLNMSRAGTNPYANGILSSGYENYASITSQPSYMSSQSYVVAIEAFPNECGGGTTSQFAPKQTWNTREFTATCISADTTKLSLVAMGYDLSSPRLIKTDNYARSGSTTDINYSQMDSMAFKKDGSMSKIAQTDARGNGTATVYKIGIYDVATKVTTYLKDSTGKDIATSEALRAVEWTPDNSKLYFLRDDYRDGSWKYRVCSISVAGGDMNCITPKGTTDSYDQTQSNDPIWSYDLSSLYLRSGKLSATNKYVSNIFKYSTTYNNFTKVVDAGISGNYMMSVLSPDSRYLVATNMNNIDSSGNSTWLTQVLDTSTNTFVSGTTIKNSNIIWQATKAGTPIITLPPDSGPPLVSNYLVSCTASFGRLARGVLPVTVTYTNNGPDNTPAVNTGSLLLKSPTELLVVSSTAIPSLPRYGSFTWNTQASSFGRRSTYTVSSNYINQSGAQLAICSGTKTFTTK